MELCNPYQPSWKNLLLYIQSYSVLSKNQILHYKGIEHFEYVVCKQ